MNKKLLFIILLAIIFSSCNEINPNKIIGKWQVTDIEVTDSEYSDQIIEEAKTSAMSISYNFINDSSFVLVTELFYNGMDGEWTYNPDDQTITMEYLPKEGAQKIVYKIISIKGEKMIWEMNMDGMGIITLTLTKKQL
ncbi:MAG: hypothetical protein JXL97_02295 [Bacteroidales bacterium]|nr:hypothetical protein [Bacteroidales bacterium]